ncbi:restriction endonuclease subunit S [Aeromonas sp. QDB56]|uniref:restriction endonuclease subunit S n=1 Tax=Aeromonas sp. QDB56 TaxID=2990495 RepID=UPI0022E3D8C3|nr:restriction endonuclease subunit S [Aeromonas sp. QDB56]
MSVIEHQAERVGKYQPYPEYNNSSYSWMAKIPSGWLNGPLKRIAYLQAGFAFKGDTFNSSEGVPIVRMNNILNSGGLSLDDAVRVPEIDVKPEFYLATGDIVMGMSGSIENIAKVQGDDLPCALNQRVGRFFLRAVDDGFLWYIIQSNGFKQQVSLAATGTAQLNISSDQVGNTLVSWPVSLLEQNIIAAFLDYETARIDRLIAQQQRLIELLKEKRQAVISHAVTKGLNPKAPMKDSGVEWLGQVPEHWAVVKLSYVLSLKSGDGITSNEIEPEGTYPVYGGNGLRGYCEQFNCNGTYALIGRQGALCGNVNVADGKFFASEHAVVVYPRIQFDVRFLSEFLRFMDLGQYSVSAAQPGISVERISMLSIAVPPIEEQSLIGQRISQVDLQIERLVVKAEAGVLLLKERRTALISAAVTGKIDLRGWTPPADEVAA